MKHIETFKVFESKTEEQSWDQIIDTILEVMDDFGVLEEPEEEEGEDGNGYWTDFVDEPDHPYYAIGYNIDGTIRGVYIMNIESKLKIKEIMNRLQDIKNKCEIRSKIEIEIRYSSIDNCILINKK
jgi:hypothetical protein